MKNRVILIIVFSSFVIGKMHAQCDSLKDVTFDGPIVPQVLNLNDFYPPNVDPPLPPDSNEVRRIYFIHGLGGDKTAWNKAAEACMNKSLNISGFPARKCRADRPDYITSTTSLYWAADDVRSTIENQAGLDSTLYGMRPSRAIVIAHSQGGVVMRQLMHMNMVQDTHLLPIHGMSYGGVVTVASPLQGAAILKNRQKIFALVNDGCKKLVVGPEFDLVSNVNIKLNLNGFGGWIVSLFDLEDKLNTQIEKLLSNMLNNMTDPVCDFATNNIMPMFFKQYYDGITDFYNPGISQGINHINTLNQDTTNNQYKKFPKMAFYAVEPQENLFWRTLNWMYYDPNGNNGQKGPNVGCFEANDDWRLYDSMARPLIDLYKSKSKGYQTLYNFYNLRATDAFIRGDVYAYLAAENRAMNAYFGQLSWEEGLTWLNNINESWQIIIGAKTINWRKDLGGDPWG